MNTRSPKTAHPRSPATRWEILSLKRFPSPVFFRPFPHSSIPSAPASPQAGDGDVAGVPGLKWLDYGQEASDEYP